ncbi:aminopeptidase [Candidatus Woesearchaeota archaeon]|nr:aminopeptidase [Candidatus Woesearchaeota archaeon]
MNRRTSLQTIIAYLGIQVFSPALLSGCMPAEPVYGYHHSYDKLVAKLGIPEAYREKAKFIIDITDFGNNVLGLNSKDNFSRYEKDKINYLLFACKPFQIADSYSSQEVSQYLLFTDKKKFEAEVAKLKAQGYDVSTRTGIVATAAQMTNDFLQRELSDILSTALHENMHNTINVTERLAEPIASVVEYQGLELYLLERAPKHAATELKRRARQREHYLKGRRTAVIKAAERLEELYNSRLPIERKAKDKEIILENLRREMEAAHQGAYGTHGDVGKLNNANVTDLITYSKYYADAEAVLTASTGLPAAIKVYKKVPYDLSEGLSFLRAHHKKK